MSVSANIFFMIAIPTSAFLGYMNWPMLILITILASLPLSSSITAWLAVFFQQLMHEVLPKLKIRHWIDAVHTMKDVRVVDAKINAPPYKTWPPLHALSTDGIILMHLIDGVHTTFELVVIQNHGRDDSLLLFFLAKDSLSFCW